MQTWNPIEHMNAARDVHRMRGTSGGKGARKSAYRPGEAASLPAWQVKLDSDLAALREQCAQIAAHCDYILRPDVYEIPF